MNETYTVRTLIDGLNDDVEFESEILANAYYSSTVDRYRRTDCPTEVGIQLLSPGGEIEFEETVEVSA